MGDGIRARRRSDKMFVWAIYTIGKAIDESTGGTSGSFTLTSSRYKMAASSYTVSASGTISLEGATQKTASQIAVGDYLVNVSTSNSTATTGNSIYKVTAVSGSSSRTITYTSYTPVDAVGEDTGNRVEGEPFTYPNDGIYNGYWYVLIRGKTTIHVWDIYNVTQKANYITVSSSGSRLYTDGDEEIYYASSYREDNDKIWLVSPSTTTVASFTGFSTYYWALTNYGAVVHKGGTKANNNNISGYTKYTRENNPIPTKGTSTGKAVLSAARSMYPSDGKDGNYWYVYNHSYEGRIDLT